MKRYEAETGEKATFVYIEKDIEGNEKHVDITTGGFDVWAVEEAELLNEENSKLKAQLTWRPVSEKPERADVYFVEAKPYTGCESKNITTAYFDGESFLWHDVVRWLPIPPAPEGEVK